MVPQQVYKLRMIVLHVHLECIVVVYILLVQVEIVALDSTVHRDQKTLGV